MDQATLVETGMRLYQTNLVLTSMYCLWIYDYFLTFADEIKYAWSGKKSWIFALFIANRYIPFLNVIHVNITMFGHIKTVLFAAIESNLITVIAQIIITLRIYALTERSKLLCAPLVFVILVQICDAFVATVRYMSFPVPPVPEPFFNLFGLCLIQRWRPGTFLYVVTSFSFDVLAILIIVARTKRLVKSGYPGIPTLLSTILRDSTVYFLVIFLIQFLVLLFLFVTPGAIQILPGVANTTLVPIMITRLMLSLKEAAAEPAGSWSLETMTDVSSGRSPREGTLRFAPQTLYVSQETVETPSAPNEVDMELETVPRASQNRESRELC